MAERIHIKSPGEVAKMQKAGAVTAEILMEIGAEVQVGRTTREIDDIAREIFKKHKVGNSFYRYRGFPGQLCISINEEVVHGSGGPRRIQNGDIVSLDVGAIEYIHRQIVAQRDKNKAVLLVSLELDEVMSLSDRILVMYEGEIVGELDPKKTTVEELGLYMAGAKREVHGA